MNDITEVDRLNAEIADLKKTVEWLQGRIGITMGATARAEIAGPSDGHPLDGLHINKGSMDAASDAYFHEWQKSKCRTAYENRYHKVAALCPYDEWEACWFKALSAVPVPPQSLLRAPISATNPLPPGCYCKPGQCGAPKPNWCRDHAKRDSAIPVEQAEKQK